MTNCCQNYLFLGFFFLSTALFAQNPIYEVRGNVRDSLSNETLPFASVFFSGTTYGTTSDKNGDFVLRVDKPGTYDLVISFTGFSTFFSQLDLNTPGSKVVNVALLTDVKLIGGVTVTAKKDEKWKRNLGTFKRVFLGTSENVARCKILNEEVLNFDFNTGDQTFEAYAGEPLIIENKTLGYRITYLLEHFMIYYRYNYSTFYGFPSFRDMTREGKKVKKRWVKARNKAYYGSVDHFMRELYAGNTYEAGFRLNKAKDIEGIGRVFDTSEFSINEVVRPDSTGMRKQFGFKDYLYITYLNEEPDPNYRPGWRQRKGPEATSGLRQMSWISMADSTELIRFEKSGYLVNPLSIVLAGYWSFEKVADLLPINYVLLTDKR